MRAGGNSVPQSLIDLSSCLPLFTTLLFGHLVTRACGADHESPVLSLGLRISLFISKCRGAFVLGPLHSFFHSPVPLSSPSPSSSLPPAPVCHPPPRIKAIPSSMTPPLLLFHLMLPGRTPRQHCRTSVCDWITTLRSLNASSRTPFLTCSPTHSLALSLSHSLTRSLTPSPTHG